MLAYERDRCYTVELHAVQMAVSWLTDILALKVLLKKSIFTPLVYSLRFLNKDT